MTRTVFLLTTPYAILGSILCGGQIPQISCANDLISSQSNMAVDIGEKGDPHTAVTGPQATTAANGQTQQAHNRLAPKMLTLRERVRACLAYHFCQRENVARRDPWEIMHCLIAYGVDTEIDVNGRRTNAIDWLCRNGSCGGERLLEINDSHLRARSGHRLQGHDGQFLAVLAQCNVDPAYQINVNGHVCTVRDLIHYEKLSSRSDGELTFKLIGLAHYLNPDSKWRNEHGQDWDIPKLIREELAKSVVEGACGGTHRMMGFSYAVRQRQRYGGPFEGQWLRAKRYVEAYQKHAFMLQNADGSFSTNWFQGRGPRGTLARHLKTTGHTLEWLVFSLPNEQLKEERVLKSVVYLTNLLLDHKDYPWEVGPKSHALHALSLYDQCVFGEMTDKRNSGDSLTGQDLASSHEQVPPMLQD